MKKRDKEEERRKSRSLEKKEILEKISKKKNRRIDQNRPKRFYLKTGFFGVGQAGCKEITSWLTGNEQLYQPHMLS